MSNASSANGRQRSVQPSLDYAAMKKDDLLVEPPLLENKVLPSEAARSPAKPPLAAGPVVSAATSTNSTSAASEVKRASAMTVSSKDTKNTDTKKLPSKAAPKDTSSKAALQRRASDGPPPTPTIDNVRELLLGDSLKKNRQELQHVERKTTDQLGNLREELGDRIDRVVRALSTVNQAVHREFTAREEAVRESAAVLEAKSEALATKTEDRLSFLEAKIYTVVADMERKVSAVQEADKDRLLEQLAASSSETEARVTELAAKVEQQLDTFGSRITTEIAQVSGLVAAAQVKAGADAEELGGQVGKRLGAVEAQLGAELNQLRDDIGRSSAQLQSELTAHAASQTAKLAQTQEETQAQLSEHVQELEGRKVSRSDFSVLLQELASRLDEDESSI